MPCEAVRVDVLKAYPEHLFHYPDHQQESPAHLLLQKALSSQGCSIGFRYGFIPSLIYIADTLSYLTLFQYSSTIIPFGKTPLMVNLSLSTANLYAIITSVF